MLESLEQSNIKKMSVENPEHKDVIFDAAHDITTEDWEKIKEQARIERGRESTSTSSYLHFVAMVKRINPKFEIEYKDSFPHIQYYYARLQESYKKNLTSPREIAYAKEIFPDLRIGHLEEYKQPWKDLIGNLRKNDYLTYAEAGPALLQLGLTKQDIGWDEHSYKWMEEGLNEYEERGDGISYATVAAGMKLLEPEKEIAISEEMKARMHLTLEDLKEQGGWTLFVRLAAYMNELNPKNQGELNKSEQIIPEQRSF